jgi:Rap1a immunity proteins
MKLSCAIVVFWCAASRCACAENRFYYTADMLAPLCRIDIRIADTKSGTITEMSESAACVSYVDGVLDTLEAVKEWHWTPSRELVCIPEGVTSNQVEKVFLKYTDDHPEELHKAATAALWDAIHNVFPCAGH